MFEICCKCCNTREIIHGSVLEDMQMLINIKSTENISEP